MISRFLIVFALTMSSLFAQEPSPNPSPAPSATPPPPKLDEVVMSPTFWDQTVETLTPTLAALKFAWISTTQDGARSISPDLSLGGHHVDEAIFRFGEQKPTSAQLLLYSRGLSKELNERLFDALTENVQQAITNQVGSAPQKKARDTGSVVRADGVEWVYGPSKLVLEWSATKNPFRAEFLRLIIRPNVEEKRAIGEVQTGNTNRAAVKKFSGLEHVVKENGDVKIPDVPMVDQGERGYCVVASVERVMTYYGATVDQTELAQIANSDAGKGTSSTEMVDSLNRLTGRLGVKVRTLEEWQYPEFLKLVDDYNRVAKRAKKRSVQGGGRTLQDYYMQMEPEIYKEVRLKKASDLTKFQRDIAKNIDEGIPLLWSVHLGMIPEGKLKQYAGGHMRLIIGYNSAKQEIIYSDSWGSGHEEKRMSMEDAWVITSGLNSLQPIGT